MLTSFPQLVHSILHIRDDKRLWCIPRLLRPNLLTLLHTKRNRLDRFNPTLLPILHGNLCRPPLRRRLFLLPNLFRFPPLSSSILPPLPSTPRRILSSLPLPRRSSRPSPGVSLPPSRQCHRTPFQAEKEFRNGTRHHR